MDRALLRGFGYADPESEATRLPLLGEVSYRGSNPDRTRKTCASCALWRSDSEACLVHDAEIVASAQMICRFHLFGAALPENTQPLFALDPNLTGIRMTEHGASCDVCEHYDTHGSLGGTCLATLDPVVQSRGPLVESLGYCGRWSPSP